MRAVVTRGYASGGSIPLVVRRGFISSQTPVIVTPSIPRGGGRIIGALPYEEKKKKVILQLPPPPDRWNEEKEKELKQLVKFRAKEFSELLDTTLQALQVANTVAISANLTEQQITKLRKRLNEEDCLLLLDIFH